MKEPPYELLVRDGPGLPWRVVLAVPGTRNSVKRVGNWLRDYEAGIRRPNDYAIRWTAGIGEHSLLPLHYRKTDKRYKGPIPEPVP